MNIPSDLKYTQHHVWVSFLDERTVRVGVTDLACAAAGRIEFVMSGHTHADWSTVIDDCPVFSTTLFRGSEPTYDLMYADYDERKLYCVRVGCGGSFAWPTASRPGGGMSIVSSITGKPIGRAKSQLR